MAPLINVRSMMDKHVVAQIVSAILDQGELTKSQIVETWQLTKEEYTELGKLLRKQTSIRPGPQRSGGFVAVARKGAFPDEGAGDEIGFETDRQRQTVERLEALLDHPTLEGLLGPLLQTVRQVRKQET
jgi:hypothetical protein